VHTAQKKASISNAKKDSTMNRRHQQSTPTNTIEEEGESNNSIVSEQDSATLADNSFLGQRSSVQPPTDCQVVTESCDWFTMIPQWIKNDGKGRKEEVTYDFDFDVDVATPDEPTTTTTPPTSPEPASLREPASTLLSRIGVVWPIIFTPNSSPQNDDRGKSDVVANRE
jgi:hypothetical protein